MTIKGLIINYLSKQDEPQSATQIARGILCAPASVSAVLYEMRNQVHPVVRIVDAYGPRDGQRYELVQPS